jgi:8-oxo-dGTP pyrophosphatase MutT (NUDIX family)
MKGREMGESMELNTIISKLKDRSPSILGEESFSKYAILLPLVRKEDEIHVVFEVRSLKLRRQPGEICFPGGRIDDDDKNEKKAALRETTEELGIKVENISGVFPLDILLSPFGMIIYPYAGIVDNFEKIQPNPSEVGEIFTVPLTFFLENEPEIYYVDLKPEPEKNFPFDLIAGGKNYRWQMKQMDEFFYLYENRVIWGLTAKILAHFVEILRREGLNPES